MSFELHQRQHVEHELEKVARRELRKAAHALTASAAGRFETAVHDSRKRVKKVRAVAALLGQAGTKVPRKDRKRLKAAATALSRLRDSAAIIETFDRVRRQYPTQLSVQTYGVLRRALVGARNRARERAQRDDVVGKAAERLARARKSARHWASSPIDISGMVAVIVDSYRRSREAMQRARETGQSATLHRWRKELKTFWYQLRLTKPLTSGAAPLVAGLKRLETALGDDHNLVILAATLRGCRDMHTLRAEIRHISRLAARMRQPLRRRAFALGRRLHVRKPKAFGRWIGKSTKPADPKSAPV